MRTTILLIGIACSILVACASPQKLYDKGKYGSVLSKLDAKAKKAKLTEEEVRIMIESIANWTDKKTNQLKALRDSPNYKKWLSGNKEISKIEQRQAKFKTYPQLQLFELTKVNTVDWKEDFDVALYHHYHDQFDNYIKRYDEGGTRNEVFKAYALTKEIEKYTTDNSHIESLRNLCLDLGHRTFKVYDFNHSFGSLLTFDHFVDAVDYNSDLWNTFNNNLPDSLTDYIIHYGIEDVDTNEDTEDSYESYSRDIIVSTQTETDTSGNVTEIPVYETITARVKTTSYRYIASAEATLSITSLALNERVFYQSYQSQKQDEIVLNYLDSGDPDALPDDVSLESVSIQNYDYDDLIEAVFEDLGRQVGSDFHNGNIL